ncbi:DUF397 domain-containing protein [Amycolatopsis sp. NPDC004378]
MHPRHKWFVSSRTGQNNDPACVEVMFLDDAICVRDTKSRHRGLLAVSVSAWRNLIAEAKSGRLDIF